MEARESLPDPDWVKRMGGIVVQVADHFGAPTFLIQVGSLVAEVFFVPEWGLKAKATVKSSVVMSYDFWIVSIEKLPHDEPEKPANRWVILTPCVNTLDELVTFFDTGRIAAGTRFIPIAGREIT